MTSHFGTGYLLHGTHQKIDSVKVGLIHSPTSMDSRIQSLFYRVNHIITVKADHSFTVQGEFESSKSLHKKQEVPQEESEKDSKSQETDKVHQAKEVRGWRYILIKLC